MSAHITVAPASYREFWGSSVSGDISLTGSPTADARLDVDTMSGDIRVDFPTSVSARVSAETFSGRIRSDFGTVDEPGHGPGRPLDATVGSGGARGTGGTFSGDINIRRE